VARTVVTIASPTVFTGGIVATIAKKA
jgi:hypothetical protein